MQYTNILMNVILILDAFPSGIAQFQWTILSQRAMYCTIRKYKEKELQKQLVTLFVTDKNLPRRTISSFCCGTNSLIRKRE